MNTQHTQTGQQATKLPIGYRFAPTDKELVIHYLTNKIISGRVPANVGEDMEADYFYSQYPFDHVTYADGEREWYYFIHEEDEKSRRKRKGIPARTVGNGLGFWKKTGEETIFSDGGEVSAIKYKFTFLRKRVDKPKKTHWRMDEYELTSHIYVENDIQGMIVLIKLMRGKDYDIF